MDYIREFNLLEKKEMNNLDSKETMNFSRRNFLKTVGIGSGGLITFGGWLVKSADAQKKAVYSLIVVDFNKCTFAEVAYSFRLVSVRI